MPWGDDDKVVQTSGWGTSDKKRRKVSWGEDVVASGLTGIGQSATGLLGSFGDAQKIGALLGSKIGGLLGASEEDQARGRQVTGLLGPQLPTSGLLNQKTGLTYEPRTTTGKFARAVGANAPSALVPGTAGVRLANVVAPALASESAGLAVEAAGGSEGAATAARIAGGLAGGLGASVRVGRGNPARVLPTQDPARVGAEVARYRAAGIEPALVDVVDDSARGTIRAAASRQTPARQAATDFADSRALDLPDRMSQQARTIVSSDPRTPGQIQADLSATRRTNADAAYGAVRGDTLGLAPETVQALRNPRGRTAITEAASRETDPNIRAALNRLANDALDNPGQTQITVGMADRISRTLYGQAQAAARSGDNDLARIYTQLGDDVRNPARAASPGYGSAVDQYASDSRLVGASETGENFLNRNTDEFVAEVGNLNAQEQDLARASARRAIERAAGENVAAAPGVARRIATAPEQQARNAALLGQQDAERLQEAMRLEAMRVRNAQDIAPRAGSQTQLRTQEAANAAGTVVRGLRGDWLGVGVDWLRSRGMSDTQAQDLIEAALDPARTDEVINALGQEQGERLLALTRAGAAGLLTAQSQSGR